MDNQTIQSLVDAIPARKSVRTFAAEPLPEAQVGKLKGFIDSLDAPFAHTTRFELFLAEPGKKLYNNGVNPVNNMAVMAQTDLVSISKAGFAGELVMLYAVSQGLATCWFGHYKLAELGRYIPGIADPERIKESTMGYGFGKGVDVGERVICCMPFGRRDEASKRLIDAIMVRKGGNRKPLDPLMESPDMLPLASKPVLTVLDLAHLAPSAGNSQFWQFGVSEDGKTITIKKPVGYKHFKWEHPDVDIGMCAAHLWLGLLHQGLTVSVDVQQDQDRAFWTFRL